MKRCSRIDSACLFWVLAIFGACALFCSVIGNFTCQFVTIKEETSNKDIFTGIWLKKTLYWIEDTSTGEWAVYKGCGAYPDATPLDAKWKSAMAFVICSSVIGFAALLAMFFSACVPMSARIWKMTGFTLVFASICQGLTLLFLQSNACGMDRSFFGDDLGTLQFAPGCTLAWGAKLSISATALWFVPGVAMCCMNNPFEGEAEMLMGQDDKQVAPDVEEGDAEKDEKQQAAEKPADNEE